MATPYPRPGPWSSLRQASISICSRASAASLAAVFTLIDPNSSRIRWRWSCRDVHSPPSPALGVAMAALFRKACVCSQRRTSSTDRSCAEASPPSAPSDTETVSASDGTSGWGCAPLAIEGRGAGGKGAGSNAAGGTWTGGKAGGTEGDVMRRTVPFGAFSSSMCDGCASPEAGLVVGSTTVGGTAGTCANGDAGGKAGALWLRRRPELGRSFKLGESMS